MIYSYQDLSCLLEKMSPQEPLETLHSRVMENIMMSLIIGRLGPILGEIKLFKIRNKSWNKGLSGDTLYPFDKIDTGTGNKTVLILKDDSQLWLNEKTILEISPGYETLRLIEGELMAFVNPQNPEIPFVIGIPSGHLKVIGTAFNLKILPSSKTELSVLEGRVELGNSSGSLLVSQHQQAFLDTDKPPGTPDYSPLPGKIPWIIELSSEVIKQDINIPPLLIK